MAIKHVPWYRRFLNSVLSLFGVSYASFRAPTVCLQLCISCQPGASRSYQLGLTPPYLISSTGIVCRRHQWEYITIFTSPHGDKISHFMRSSTFCRGKALPSCPVTWSPWVLVQLCSLPLWRPAPHQLNLPFRGCHGDGEKNDCLYVSLYYRVGSNV